MTTRQLSIAGIIVGLLILAVSVPINDKTDITARTSLVFPLTGTVKFQFVEVTISPHTTYHLPSITEISDSVGSLFPDFPSVVFPTGELTLENTAGGKTITTQLGKINRGFGKVTTSTISEVTPDTLTLKLYENNQLKTTKEISLT